jgi:tetratricopeptide (TPR) repeat protein
MTLRFPAAFAVVAVGACLAAPALTPAAAQDPGQWLSPPSDTQRPGHGLGSGETTYSLDTLFSALKIAPDDASAKAIEDRIWALWLASGSDTCTLLMTRVKDATDDKNYDLAIKLLDAVIAIKPDYVEAWNRRATVYYLKQDALEAYRKALAIDPHLENIPEVVKTLSEKVEGRNI